MDVKELALIDKRVAVLAELCRRGIKPLSKVATERAEELANILREKGFDVRVERISCRTDLIFGYRGILELYDQVNALSGKERIRQLGILFGYPECCASYFADYMFGDAQGKPEKMEPLEHFVCPGCTESPRLKVFYEDALGFVEALLGEQ